MTPRLTVAVISGLVLALLVSIGLWSASLYFAYHWEWLSPPVAAIVAIFAGVALGPVSVLAAWEIGNRPRP
jgi:hypothetical protein